MYSSVCMRVFRLGEVHISDVQVVQTASTRSKQPLSCVLHRGYHRIPGLSGVRLQYAVQGRVL